MRNPDVAFRVCHDNGFVKSTSMHEMCIPMQMVTPPTTYQEAGLSSSIIKPATAGDNTIPEHWLS